LNQVSLASRKSCNAWEGGTANYCDALITNPFQGLAPVLGTSYYTSSTIARYNLLRPSPQFTNDINPGGDNHGASWYNSAIVNYKFRTRGGLNLITNYTFSKWVSRSGYQDPYVGTLNQGIYQADQTHIFKIVAVYQLPFGKGKHFMHDANRLVDGLLGGWELNETYIVHSGEPINFPTNSLMLNDVWNKNVDWESQQPNLWSRNYCVYSIDGAGNPQISATNTNLNSCPTKVDATGKTVADFSKYDWVIAPKYAPAVNSPQNGQHRLPRVTTMDASIGKTVAITERFKGQVRLEAFNVLNHFVINQANITTDPTSPNFGTITPSSLGSASSFPRTIQLGFKLLW
jgi:hypothetical protein